MTLKFQLDSLEGVDEAIQSLYVEKDGKFVLGIDGLPQQEDVTGLKAKVEELLGEKKAAEKARREAEEKARAEARRLPASRATSRSSRSPGPRSTTAAKLS